MRIAVDGRRPTADGWVETVDYFSIAVFGVQGEICDRYLAKGRAIAVEGRLNWREVGSLRVVKGGAAYCLCCRVNVGRGARLIQVPMYWCRCIEGMPIRRPILGVALFPLLAAGLAWGWAELAELVVVPKGSNLVVFVTLVLAAGVGVGYCARRAGSRQVAVPLMIVVGMALAAAMCFFAMLYVAARHGNLG
jgi:hypothetical protein